MNESNSHKLTDWLNSINQFKKNLMDEDPSVEKSIHLIINKALSAHTDAVCLLMR